MVEGLELDELPGSFAPIPFCDYAICAECWPCRSECKAGRTSTALICPQKTVYGANVIVFEGILAFANKELLKVLLAAWCGWWPISVCGVAGDVWWCAAVGWVLAWPGS